MKRWFPSLLLSALLFAAAAPAYVYAASPTLSLSGGSDRSVDLRITADPKTRIFLYYPDDSGDTTSTRIGTTDSGGYLATSVDSDDYNLNEGDTVYIVADEAGSPRSSSHQWPSLSSGPFSLLASTITLGVGQTTVVPANNVGSGSLEISNNSNSSVATISGNGPQVQVVGKKVGSATALVCLVDDSSDCEKLTVTVADTATQSFSLSVPVAAVVVGRSTTVSIGGSINRLYVSSNSKPSAVQANLSSNVLTLVGLTTGISKVTVCNASNECATVQVTVIANKNTPNGFGLTKSSVSLLVGDTAQIPIAGDGSYTLSGTSNSKVASAALRGGGSIFVTALAAGTRSVSICDDLSDCTWLDISVSAAPTPAPAPAPSGGTTSTPAKGDGYVFTSFLDIDATGTEVTELQTRLTVLGFYSGPVTGYFGPLTAAGVKAFQKARGITQAGYVGPATRAALNAK